MRNFGIPKVTSPATSGGNGQSPGSRSAGAHADNVIQMADYTQPELERLTAPLFIPDSADQDMAALLFALAAFGCPFALIGLGITFWLLFF